MRKRNIGVYLDDILECIAKIEDYTTHISEEEFFKNTQIQDAVMRRLEIIGEAVKHLPKKFKSDYPDIAWRDIGDTRNVLIHDYLV